ncbi:flavin reductase family protein (plasmid) [Pseudoalteromonas sp. T1lg65]|uniref:flavin reductase family protein n=1 Tax=Pseudoalteromonas sp. T1lg65 TaxID=2077101 RepID=UPI003F795D30
MQTFSNSDINQLEQRYRALLINSLSGFKSANLIGTVDSSGQENLSIVSSVFHLGAHPPLVGTIFRPHSVPRHTLENIIETGFYTINQVNNQIVKQAHQTSARYDKSQSEFAEVGLSAQYIADFFAPYVKESRLKYGLSLQHHQIIELNQTVLLIGQVEALHVEAEAIQSDGHIDLEKLGTVAISGLDSYHNTSSIERYKYAKPNQPVEPL